MTLAQLQARARTATEREAHQRRVLRVQQILWELRAKQIRPDTARMALEHAGVGEEAARDMVRQAR